MEANTNPNFNEVNGDLISLAKAGTFDVIAHGCNCFCTMGAGIAPLMAEAFGADSFPKEDKMYYGDVNKLGTIDHKSIPLRDSEGKFNGSVVRVVNAYTQYDFGSNHEGGRAMPVDYEAIRLVMRKMNHLFQGSHIGLPLIGCGLAGGDWNVVKRIIQEELTDCTVTIVHYKPASRKLDLSTSEGSQQWG